MAIAPSTILARPIVRRLAMAFAKELRIIVRKIAILAMEFANLVTLVPPIVRRPVMEFAKALRRLVQPIATLATVFVSPTILALQIARRRATEFASPMILASMIVPLRVTEFVTRAIHAQPIATLAIIFASPMTLVQEIAILVTEFVSLEMRARPIVHRLATESAKELRILVQMIAILLRRHRHLLRNPVPTMEIAPARRQEIAAILITACVKFARHRVVLPDPAA